MQLHGSKYFVLTHTLDPGVESKQLILLKVVMLHIRLKGMEHHRAPCKHIFCPNTHPRPLWWDQKVKIFFIKTSHVVYQI